MAARNRPLRLLFLAFGFSIHAYRRIGLFAADPDFQVHVASDHAYEIEGAAVTRLDGRDGLVRAKARLPVFVNAAGRFLARAGVKEVSNPLFQELVTQLFAYRQLLGAARRFRPDAVFLQTLLYPSYLACLLPASIPRLITFWNGDLVWWAQQNEILKTFKRQIVETGIRSATAITVNSQTARAAALEYGIDPARLHVIRYPGVDLEHFCPGDKAAARQRLGLPAKGPVVLCPRGLGGYLNADVLFEAACAVCSVLPDVSFLFVSGVGLDHWDDLMRLPRGIGLEDRFRHDGQIPWTDMPDYYRAADIMVSPSSNDSQPNCMLEAMACGTPVVMGDIPAIREWVSGARNGLLFPPRDSTALAKAMLSLLRDPARGAIFAAMNHRIVADRVDTKTQCRQIKDLVIQTLAGNAAS